MRFFQLGFVELTLVALVVVVVLLVTRRRLTPDPTGRRPMAIYLLSVMFITLFTAAGAIAQMGRTFSQNVTDGGGAVWTVTAGPSFTHYERVPERAPLEPLQDPTAHTYSLDASRTLSEVLRAVLVFGLAVAIFEFHRRRWRTLLRKETGDG